MLLEFPIEVVSALVAGRWAVSASAARPFLAGYRLRLGMAAVVTALVRRNSRTTMCFLTMIIDLVASGNSQGSRVTVTQPSRAGTRCSWAGVPL